MKTSPHCKRKMPDNAPLCPDCKQEMLKNPALIKKSGVVLAVTGIVVISLIFITSLNQNHAHSRLIKDDLDFGTLLHQMSFEGVTSEFLESAKNRQEAAPEGESTFDSAASAPLTSGVISHIPASAVSKTAAFPVAMSVDSVTKDTYYVGEMWTPGTVNFKIEYSDGSVKYDSYNVGTKNTVMKGPGTHTMTFNYYGYENVTCTYDFKVLAAGSVPTSSTASIASSAASSIYSSVVTSFSSGTTARPTAISVVSVAKSTYYVGEQWTPGTVNFRIDYSDGSVKFDSHNVGTQNTSMKSPGTQTVTFTYYGYDISCTYTFTVLAGTPSSGTTSRSENAVPVGMSIAALTKDTYFVGEEFDSQSVSFKINYSDGTSEFTSYNYDMRGFTSVVPGKVQVTFSIYGRHDISCAAVLTIVAKEGTSSGASSGTSSSATSNTSASTSSGSSTSTSSGTSSNTSSTAAVAHTPENAVGTTVYISTPYKMVYHVGEAFDPAGLEVSIQFPDGKFFVDGYSLSGFDSTKPGTVYLRITYGKCDGGFTVTIVA